MAAGPTFATFLFLDMYLEDDDMQWVAQMLCMWKTVNRREHVPRIEGYAERILPLYTEQDFRYHYRITRHAFERLITALGPHLTSHHLGGAEEVEPSKQLLAFVWYMSTQESLREIAQMFDMSKSTTHAVIYRVMKAMCSHLSNIIAWPDAQQQHDISNDLQASHGIAGVIGFIDGTHIRLPICPKEDQDYINRKGYPLIQLQVVVDNTLLIRNAYAGWPGCTHDARVLRNSKLYREAEAGRLFSPNKFIIGDSAYPVKHWLITPYKEIRNLRPEQTRFNKRLSSMRQCVERAFGHVKCRFRRL